MLLDGEKSGVDITALTIAGIEAQPVATSVFSRGSMGRRPTIENRVAVHISIPLTLKERIEADAERLSISKAEMYRRIVEKYYGEDHEPAAPIEMTEAVEKRGRLFLTLLLGKLSGRPRDTIKVSKIQLIGAVGVKRFEDCVNAAEWGAQALTKGGFEAMIDIDKRKRITKGIHVRLLDEPLTKDNLQEVIDALD